MGLKSKAAKAMFVFAMLNPGTFFAFGMFGYFDDAPPDHMEQFLSLYTDPFTDPEYLDNLAALEPPSRQNMEPMYQFWILLALFGGPSMLGIFAGTWWTISWARSRAAERSMPCPVCEKRSGGSTNYTMYTIMTAARAVSTIQVHHSCYPRAQGLSGGRQGRPTGSTTSW